VPAPAIMYVARVHGAPQNPNSATFGDSCGLTRTRGRFSNSGSLAIFTAILRASSHVSNLVEDRTLRYGAAAGLCFRKPSLIACLIPSSISVFATSGTLVP
jgi:hypothetical protein